MAFISAWISERSVVEQFVNFRIGIVEIVRNGEVTLRAAEDPLLRRLFQWHELSDRGSRLGDNHFFPQCDALEQTGEMSFRLVDVDFHI
jgi:hypothetical protein